MFFVSNTLKLRVFGIFSSNLLKLKLKLEEVVKNLESTLNLKQKETTEWKLKYNIRTAEQA